MKNHATILWDDGCQAYCVDIRADMSEEDIEFVKTHLPVEDYLSINYFNRFIMKPSFDPNDQKQFVLARLTLDMPFKTREEEFSSPLPCEDNLAASVELFKKMSEVGLKKKWSWE